MRARAFALSAAVLLAAGCGGAGRAPVFDAIARALPPLAGESKSEAKDEAKNESSSAPSSASASASGGGGFYLDDGPPADSLRRFGGDSRCRAARGADSRRAQSSV